MSLLQEALYQLWNGNFVKVWKGALREADTRIDRHIPWVIEHVIDEDGPLWLNSVDKTQFYRLTKNQYGAVLGQSQFTVTHSADFEAIEIPLTLLKESEAVHINRANTDSTDTSTITPDDSFNYPPVFWTAVELPAKTTTAQISVDIDTADSVLNRWKRQLIRLFSSNEEQARTRVGLPAIVPSNPQPPVFLISVDSLRYDCQSELAPLIDALGPNTVIPDEPRTQATWTLPSHASMITGTHPGTHGLVGWGDGEGDKRPIDPDIQTVPELLTEQGYKCSGLVHHSRLTPEFGFGKGFHRLYEDAMTWSDYVTRTNDARASVDKVIKWVDEDIANRNHSLFYFVHLFDPHLPYVPPIHLLDSGDIDLSKPKEMRQQVKDAHDDYIRGYETSQNIPDPELITEMQSWYSKTVEYTADQLARFFNHLKNVGLFNDALIIITGDHGEEFGERGFHGHQSLYDNNIRPFMTVKQPLETEWDVPEQVGTIDFLPTIVTAAGGDIPDHCEGVPIQNEDSGNRSQITERIRPDWYSVAVETDGRKGIFIYETAYPDRPSVDTTKQEARLKEFHHLPSIRSGADYEFSTQEKDELKSLVEEFLKTDSKAYTADVAATRPSQETMNQLENLGYK
jgi:arylsulfatase A-like enzyme